MAHTITIDNAATALNQFVTAFGRQIHQNLRQGLEFESVLPFQPCEHSFTDVNVSISGGMQPYQAAFTPNNAETFDAVTNTLRPIKIDLQFDEEQLYNFWTRWQANWFESGRDPNEWSYPRYIIEQVLLDKFREELNTTSWSGVYTAPTAGTPGNYTEAVDGFKKVIEDAITAGDVVPIATGAPTAGGEVEWIESFVASLPGPYRERGGIIFCSESIARKYYQDWRATFGYAAGNSDLDNREMLIDIEPGIRLRKVYAMGNSNRLIFVPNGTDNMIVGTRTGYPVYPVFNFQPDVRTLKVYATIYRFYGFRHWGHLFVNDQA